jgi:hypothetical protein
VRVLRAQRLPGPPILWAIGEAMAEAMRRWERVDKLPAVGAPRPECSDSESLGRLVFQRDASA